MNSILDKARAGQTALEQIANAIPGFHGYREKELRRDADRLTREHMASRLEECKKPLNELAAQVSRSGALDFINDIETARKRLEKIVARIRYAERGYSGFFDTIKVDEAALGRVYDFDLALLAGVEQIQGIARAAAAAPAEAKAALQELLAKIDGLEASLNDRESVLRGLK